MNNTIKKLGNGDFEVEKPDAYKSQELPFNGLTVSYIRSLQLQKL